MIGLSDGRSWWRGIHLHPTQFAFKWSIEHKSPKQKLSTFQQERSNRRTVSPVPNNGRSALENLFRCGGFKWLPRAQPHLFSKVVNLDACMVSNLTEGNTDQTFVRNATTGPSTTHRRWGGVQFAESSFDIFGGLIHNAAHACGKPSGLQLGWDSTVLHSQELHTFSANERLFFIASTYWMLVSSMQEAVKAAIWYISAQVPSSGSYITMHNCLPPSLVRAAGESKLKADWLWLLSTPKYHSVQEAFSRGTQSETQDLLWTLNFRFIFALRCRRG